MPPAMRRFASSAPSLWGRSIVIGLVMRAWTSFQAQSAPAWQVPSRSRERTGAAAASGREAAPVQRREAPPEVYRFLHDVVAVIAVECRLIDQNGERKIEQEGLEHRPGLAV